jgi:hypothetical protein
MMPIDNPPSKRKIFLSYRHADHADFAERIRDWFAWKYGRESVFMDFDTISLFSRFADDIDTQIAECDVLVAIIGPTWVNELRTRIDNGEKDYVRHEIRLALEKGKPIAPIRIKGAGAPRRRDLPSDLQPMMEYHFAELDSGRHFLDNIERIVNGVEELLARLDMFQSVTQDIQSYRPPEFNIQGAILSFQDAADQEDWYTAREWLSKIRHSGFMPRFYPIDDYEREVNEAIERLEAERDYGVIRSMAERAAKGRESRERVWSALQAFWETHPGYDPDDLTSQFRPGQVHELATKIEGTSFTPTAELQVSKRLDLSIFDHADTINPEALEVLLGEAALVSIAERLEDDSKTLSFEEVQRLGILPAFDE